MKKNRKLALILVALALVVLLSVVVARALTPPRVDCYMSAQSVNLVKSSGLVKVGFTNEKTSEVSLDVFLVLPEWDDMVVCSQMDLTPNSILLDMGVSQETSDALPAGEYKARLDAYISGTNRLCYSEPIGLFVWNNTDDYFAEGLG